MSKPPFYLGSVAPSSAGHISPRFLAVIYQSEDGTSVARAYGDTEGEAKQRGECIVEALTRGAVAALLPGVCKARDYLLAYKRGELSAEGAASYALTALNGEDS